MKTKLTLLFFLAAHLSFAQTPVDLANASGYPIWTYCSAGPVIGTKDGSTLPPEVVNWALASIAAGSIQPITFPLGPNAPH